MHSLSGSAFSTIISGQLRSGQGTTGCGRSDPTACSGMTCCSFTYSLKEYRRRACGGRARAADGTPGGQNGTWLPGSGADAQWGRQPWIRCSCGVGDGRGTAAEVPRKDMVLCMCHRGTSSRSQRWSGNERTLPLKLKGCPEVERLKEDSSGMPRDQHSDVWVGDVGKTPGTVVAEPWAWAPGCTGLGP